MARVIKFFGQQVFQIGTVYSEVFDAVDIGRLDAELRVITGQGTAPTITGVIQTASDPCLDDNCWSTVTGTASLTGAGSPSTATGAFSGLGRFLRAKLTVAGTAPYVTASLHAVGRER